MPNGPITVGLTFTIATLSGCSTHTPDKRSFFVTSQPIGSGGNLGAADAHCQRLAEAAGTTGRQWRAYLSVAFASGQPAVNARDRIGSGAMVQFARCTTAAFRETGGSGLFYCLAIN